MGEITYAQAINAALRRALAEDPKTLLFGEDVALPGGVHGVTRRLRREFGDRVFDTPISESAILGGAVGAAMMGLRPIVEIMWADFAFVAFDQLINQAANVRYVSRGRPKAPMTIRTQQGATPGSCAQHSQRGGVVRAHPGPAGMPARHPAGRLRPATGRDRVRRSRRRHREPGALSLAEGHGGPRRTPVADRRRAHRPPGLDISVVTWGPMLCTPFWRPPMPWRKTASTSR